MKIYFLFCLIGIVLFSCNKGIGDISLTQPHNDTASFSNDVADRLASGWIKVHLPNKDTIDLEDIYFNDSMNVYAISDKNVYHSVDGGFKWKKIYTADQFLANLAVTKNGNVYIAANDGYCYKLIPGRSFTKQYIGMQSLRMEDEYPDVYFLNNDTGYYSGTEYFESPGSQPKYEIYQTVNAGSSWKFIETDSLQNRDRFFIHYCQMSFLSTKIGYVCAEFDMRHLTNNNPIWQYTNVTNEVLTSVVAVSFKVAFAATLKGNIYKTTDGGNSFNFISSLNPSKELFTDLYFFDEKTGYASVNNKMYKTTNAGKSWNQEVSLANVSIAENHFTDFNHGWACCTHGTILIYKK